MAAIQLRTAIPGPRSKELTKRRNAAVPLGVFNALPIFVERAEGAILEDVDGNRLIDFGGGIGCLNVGNRAPRVVAAIKEQVDRFLHTCFSVAPYESYLRVAEELNKRAPGRFPKKTLLVNSGAEAVENAVKIARSFTGRPAVICFEDAFHGRTLLALSLTSKTHPYKAGFQPFASDIYRIPYAYCYRCSYSLKYPDCNAFCAQHLEDTFKRTVAAESVAALIVEPVLGEGGFVVPPPEFFTVLQQICRKHGILFIADEVQCGFGRTGKLFACEHFGIEPDLMVTAKSLGGGTPLAAVTGREEIMDSAGVGGLGGTFGGNPLSCAAALAVFEMFDQDKLLDKANRIGERFRARALSWKQRWPLVGEVRGIGAMQAVEFVRGPGSHVPADEETKQIIRYCHEHGLVALSTGSYGNVLRLLVPLVISDEELNEGLDVIEAAIQSVAEVKPRLVTQTV